MFRQQPMPMMQNGLIGGMQQQAPKNVLNVGGGAPKAPLQQQTLQNESEPLQGGIGSLSASSVGEQFGQLRTRGPESLAGQEQYISDSNQQMEQSPLTYGTPTPDFLQPVNQLNSMQQFVSNVDKERNSPQYQDLLKRNEESKGQDKDALGQLEAYGSRFETQLAQIDPVQQQQYTQSTALSGPPASMPDMSLMQQPPPQPQMQQPQYSQQDMQGMVGLMIQMFQKAMQNNGGQSNYNAGSFGGNNMQFQQPQYSPPQPQPMTGRQRFLQNSGNNPFGQY